MALEERGEFIDSENDEEEKNMMKKNPTYVQEQEEIRDSIKKVLQEDNDNDEEENLFQPKIKTKEEIEKVSI